MFLFSCVYARMFVCLHVLTFVNNIYKHTYYVWMRVCMYVSMCLFAYVCLYVCMLSLLVDFPKEGPKERTQGKECGMGSCLDEQFWSKLQRQP